MASCKSVILENRLLAYICKIIHKLSTSINTHTFNSTDTPKDCPTMMATSKEVTNDPSKTKKEPDDKRMQLINKIKDLVKQLLVTLESWPMPLCSEYYNQVRLISIIEAFFF